MTDKNRHYRFALISDVHIDRENNGKNTYFLYAEENFKRALDVIKSRSCDFIISAGDQVTNASGAREEWQIYRSVLDSSGYGGRIYEALGNHETRSAKHGINTLSECIGDFISCTRLSDKDVIREEGKPYYYRIDPTFGDVFIFMADEAGMNVNMQDNFSDAQMDWVESLIEKSTNSGSRIFLIQHANIYGYGAGDDIGCPTYEGAIRMQDGSGNDYPNNNRFMSLIEEYKDIIWMSGHTHVDLTDNVNYSDIGCHMLHVPALAGTTRLGRDENGKRALDRTLYKGSAQGFIADVYEDKVIFSGIDFYKDRLFPEYTYIINRRRINK